MPELPVPAQIDQIHDAELLRVWTVDGTLAVRSNPQVHVDPAFYGVVLADLLSHLAQIAARASGKDAADCKREIIECFDSELHPDKEASS